MLIDGKHFINCDDIIHEKNKWKVRKKGSAFLYGNILLLFCVSGMKKARLISHPFNTLKEEFFFVFSSTFFARTIKVLSIKLLSEETMGFKQDDDFKTQI